MKIKLIILIAFLNISTYAQSNDSIRLNRYYPIIFSEIKTGWDFTEQVFFRKIEYLDNWEGILINCPQRLYYFPNIDTIPKLLFCTYERIPSRKMSFYGFNYKISVKNLNNNSLVEDRLCEYNKYEKLNNSEDYYAHQKITEALNKGTNRNLQLALNTSNDFAVQKRNINVFNYLDVSFSPGTYEIFVEYCGYESNHICTEIIFANKQTLFYPENFNNLQLSYHIDINSNCHPNINHKIGCLINVPKEIYHYPETDSTTIIPICSSAYYTRKEDILKQGNIVEIFIKNIQSNKTYKGTVDFDGRDVLGYTDSKEVLYYPQTKKERNIKASEIPEGKMCTRAFNINALDFVDMPYEAGNYEVYVKRAGYESNHMKVTIKFFYEK